MSRCGAGAGAGAGGRGQAGPLVLDRRKLFLKPLVAPKSRSLCREFAKCQNFLHTLNPMATIGKGPAFVNPSLVVLLVPFLIPW